VRESIDYPCLLLSLSIRLGVEIAGQRTENDSDTLTIHGLEGVGDSAVNVEGVQSTVKDTGSSRASTGDGPKSFLTNHVTAS
jgi:hypothetical protein